MAIRIEDSPEPLSEQSLSASGARLPLLVESDATRVLAQELRRYCKGQITGRSFLIAGHRGAGKTTLVAKAFLDVWAECERDQAFLRPVFIPLHGPSLFPERVAPGTPATVGGGEAAKAADEPAPDPPPRPTGAPKPAEGAAAAKKAEEKSEAQVALEQITLGLHRAVAKEFISRYYERSSDLAYLRINEEKHRHWLVDQQRAGNKAGTTIPFPTEDDLVRLLSRLPPNPELPQIAAQFENELYEGPTPQRLHEYWTLVDSVSGGVLFPEGYAPLMRGIQPGTLKPPPAGMRLAAPGVLGQGARELVALAGVVEAHRRISGKYEREEKEKDELTREDQRSSGWELGGKELLTPLVALLTGALAGAGVASAGKPGIEAVASGFAAALGASLVLKVSHSRKRGRSSSRQAQFIPDLTVATLDRTLPILIGRLREAGLAPVFVVDELDKVDHLGERILAMVHHLKKLVAENAFFCFLTNRSYFEEMVAKGAGLPYPKEYTYYTHRLFVVFSAEDFERYLRKRIPDPPPQAAAGPATPPTAQETDEATARALLRWVLRHRAQLHVVDLQREIAALRGESDEVSADPKELVSSPRNRIDATFQVAIELRLAQTVVQQVVKDRPDFRRLLNDAMYYLTRRWLAGDETVDLSSAGLDAFEKHLEERTGREEERRVGADGAAVGAPLPAARGLKAKECEFLFDHVGLLADFLSDRPGVETAAAEAVLDAPPASVAATPDWRREQREAWNQSRKARELTPVEGSEWDSLLLRDTDSLLVRMAPFESRSYRFRYDAASATARPAAAVAPAAARDSAAPRRRTRKAARPPVVDARTVENLELIEGMGPLLSRLQREAGTDAKEPVPIDLDTLASPHAVVSISPAWSVVSPAMRRLRDAQLQSRPYSEQDADVQLVSQFRDLLVRNAQRIGRALACAAFVGRGTATSRGPRMLRGLSVIAAAHTFPRCDEEGVRIALENVLEQVREEFALDLAPADVVLGSAADLADYEKAVAAAIGRAETPLSPPAHALLAEAGNQAWSDVLLRLERWVSTGAAGAPEIVELVAAAKGSGPSKVLGYDPQQMTAAEWVAVLVATRPQGDVSPPAAPAWLGPIALHALGFRAISLVSGPPREWLRLDSPDAQSAAAAELTARVLALAASGRLLAGSPPSSVIVVLRRNDSPKLAAWRPVAGIAAIIATSAELEALVRSDSASPSPLPPLPLTTPAERKVVAVEMEPESPAKLDTLLYPRLKTTMNGPWFVHVYWQDRGREMSPPFVVGPSSVGEIVEAAAKTRASLPERAAPLS